MHQQNVPTSEMLQRMIPLDPNLPSSARVGKRRRGRRKNGARIPNGDTVDLVEVYVEEDSFRADIHAKLMAQADEMVSAGQKLPTAAMQELVLLLENEVQKKELRKCLKEVIA
jgi:hypothetical protein